MPDPYCHYCGHNWWEGEVVCPECGSNRPLPVQLDVLENRLQVERWLEIRQHGQILEVETDPINEGFLSLRLDSDDAEMWGIFNWLSIDPGGKVAENAVNQPYYYMTFTQLLQAAAVRTAIS